MGLISPLRRACPALYWRVEGLLFHWLLSMVALWATTAGYEVAEVGDDISPCCGARTLVLANHQSTADVPLLMCAFNARPGVLPRLMWIMDRLFRYTNFGIVSLLHGDFFIVSGKSNRDASVQELSRHLRNFFIPLDRKWIVLFPEGGFLRKRRETSQRFAAKNNLPALNHVSLPRVGALKIIIDEMGPETKDNDQMNQENDCKCENKSSEKSEESVGVSTDSTPSLHSLEKLQYVLDITIGYPNADPLDLPSIVTGWKKPSTTQLHYRVFPSSDIPKDHEAMTAWLYKRFAEKEHLLEYFYRTGQFPASCPDGKIRNDKPTLVKQDRLRFLLISLFFIISTILQARIFYTLYQTFCNSFGTIDRITYEF